METFGGFRLEERLDGGGEFAFYRARRTSDPYRDVDEQVVVLRASVDATRRRWPPWADPAVATALHHPAMVSMLEEGIAGSFRYFVFEYMDGGDLRRLLPLGPMPETVGVLIAHAVVDALMAAHRAVGHDSKPLAFVHGNVSPRWVFLSRDGTAKLGGFGFGWLKPERKRELVDFAHAPPERLAGLDEDTVEGDVYQVGALLFRLLFGVDHVSPRYAQLRGDRRREFTIRHRSETSTTTGYATAVTTLMELRAEPAVQTVLANLLCDQPDERPSSMGEVRALLESLPRNDAEARAWLARALCGSSQF